MSEDSLFKYIFGLIAGGLTILSLQKLTSNEEDEEVVEAKKENFPKLTLYHNFPFRSCRVAWFLRELGIFEKINVVPGGGNRMDKSVNPHGTIPALIVEDDENSETIIESGAIVMYLAERFGKENFVPENKEQFYNMMFYCTSTVDPILDPLYMQLTHIPEENRDKERVAKLKIEFEIFAKYFTSHMEDKLYVCGSKFSAADCVVGYNIWWASIIGGGMLVKEYPVFEEYLNRLKIRQAFSATFVKKPKPSGGSL